MAAHPIVEAIDRGDVDAYIPAVVDIALRRASVINMVNQDRYTRARFDVPCELLRILEKYRVDEDAGKSDAEVVLTAYGRIRRLLADLRAQLRGASL
jgi:hypothetical protein